MNSIRLLLRPTEKVPTGSSKFFGNPDVWEGFEWPAMEDDGELYDLCFMCQINCAEAKPFDKDGLLPDSGLLYFFYDLDGMPTDSANPQAARVIYYDGDLSALREMVLVDEDGDPLAFAEQEIGFQSVNAGFLSADGETHLLLGVPSLDDGAVCGKPATRQMLLQIDSLETEDAEIDFTDVGVLCYFIEPEKLKNKDFSDVHIRQLYQ